MRDYYFKVIVGTVPSVCVLVLAKNVIEAGEKVLDTYSKAGLAAHNIEIVEITRTDIVSVIT